MDVSQTILLLTGFGISNFAAYKLGYYTAMKRVYMALSEVHEVCEECPPTEDGAEVLKLTRDMLEKHGV